jgi:DNA-binding transcriptional regulator YiaG
MNCSCGRLATVAGKCRPCHCRKLAQDRKRWTPEIEALLREAYALPKRKDLTARLDRLAMVTGFSRKTLLLRARQKGFSHSTKQRPWTVEDDAWLMDMAGTRKVSTIARMMQRSESSVTNRLNRLKVSARLQEGMTKQEFALCFGVTEHTVRKWENEGKLHVHDGRIHDHTARTFIHKYPWTYDLRRVDQTWFKGMVFGD